MDPLAQPVANSPSHIFRGTSTDPARQREILDRSQFNIPEGLQPRAPGADPEANRRAIFRSEALGVAKLVPILAAVSKVVPGIPGRAIAVLLAGVEKDPGAGRVRPASGFLSNMAPVPIGYIDPTAYGVKRNYYLRPGSTAVIPPAVDRLGLGLPEQRRLDIDNARADIARHTAQQSTLELQQFLSESTSAARSQRISARLSGRLSEEEILGIARAELLKRNAFFTPPDLELARSVSAVVLSSALLRNENLELLENTRESIDLLDTEERRIRAELAAQGITFTAARNPFAGPVAPGSIQPELIQPVRDAAKRNAEQARGIVRELVTERADP